VNRVAKAAGFSHSESRQSRSTNVTALCGLIVALILPQLPIGGWVAPGDSILALLIRELVWWLYAVGVLAWLRVGEGLPMISIGLHRPTWQGLLYALAAAGALLVVFVIHYAVIVPLFHLNATAAGAERSLILARPYWYRVLLVLRAAVVEEILFRGYLIEKVRHLTGSSTLAIAVSVAAFTYAHLANWGLVHLIPVFGGGVIFAVLYVWKRDLSSNMIAHFLTDAAGFLTS
jgi:membrane protease YdiL (CAAX protease family)